MIQSIGITMIPIFLTIFKNVGFHFITSILTFQVDKVFTG